MTTQRHSAKLFIASTLNERIPLRAYDESFKAIAQTDGQIKCEDLLFAPPFDIKFNKYNVITHVSRK